MVGREGMGDFIWLLRQTIISGVKMNLVPNVNTLGQIPCGCSNRDFWTNLQKYM